MLLTKYETYLDKTKIVMDLKRSLSIVGGDSALGKTLVYKVLERDYMAGNFNFTCYFLNSTLLHNENIIDTIINGANNSLIVIDNADIILNDRQKKFISRDKRNQYIIIAHYLSGFLLNNIRSSITIRKEKNVLIVRGN